MQNNTQAYACASMTVRFSVSAWHITSIANQAVLGGLAESYLLQGMKLRNILCLAVQYVVSHTLQVLWRQTVQSRLFCVHSTWFVYQVVMNDCTHSSS